MDHIYLQMCSYALSIGSKYDVDNIDDPKSTEEESGSSTHRNHMGNIPLCCFEHPS